jgi:hypothetical protein
MIPKPTRSILLILGISFVLGIATTALIHIFIDVFFFSVLIASLLNFLVLNIVLKKNFPLLLPSNLQKIFRVCISLLSTLMIFSFLITVPVNADRSFSIWMLSQIEQSDNTSEQIQIPGLKASAAEFFSPQSTEIERRIDEQISIQSISVDKDGYINLTLVGHIIIKTARLIQKFFGLNSKYTTGSVLE